MNRRCSDPHRLALKINLNCLEEKAARPISPALKSYEGIKPRLIFFTQKMVNLNFLARHYLIFGLSTLAISGTFMDFLFLKDFFLNYPLLELYYLFHNHTRCPFSPTVIQKTEQHFPACKRNLK